MTDKARAIGASTPEANEARLPLLPKDLGQALGALHQTDDIAVGTPTLGQKIRAKKHRYVLTRDPNYHFPDGMEDSIICADYMELVDRYKDAKEELLVGGGAGHSLQSLVPPPRCAGLILDQLEHNYSVLWPW